MTSTVDHVLTARQDGTFLNSERPEIVKIIENKKSFENPLHQYTEMYSGSLIEELTSKQLEQFKLAQTEL